MKRSELKQLAHTLTYNYRDRASLFVSLPIDTQAQVILQLSPAIQTKLFSQIDDELKVAILSYLDPDDATDILQMLPKKWQEKLLKELSTNLQEEISLLLQFDPKTAAGLMSLNYIRADAEQRMGEITEALQQHEKRTGKFPIVLVVEDKKLIGYIPNHKLVFAETNKPVKTIFAKSPRSNTLPIDVKFLNTS